MRYASAGSTVWHTLQAKIATTILQVEPEKKTKKYTVAHTLQPAEQLSCCRLEKLNDIYKNIFKIIQINHTVT